MATAAVPSHSGTEQQHLPLRVLSWLLAAASTILFMGIVPLDASWGSLFRFVLAGAYIWIAVRPRQAIAGIVQLWAAGLALVVVGTATELARLTRAGSGPASRERRLHRLRMDWPLVAAACAVIMALWPGSRPLMRASVGLSGAYVGVAMLAYPDRAGAMPGYQWGAAMVLWSVLTLLALEGRRRDRGQETKETPAD